MTSFGRLRQLEQERDLAESRLERAQASGGESRPAAEPAAEEAIDPLSAFDLPESSGPDDRELS